MGNEVEAVEDGHVRQILADLADLLANRGQRNAEAAVGAGPVVSPDRGDGEDLGVRVERGETGVEVGAVLNEGLSRCLAAPVVRAVGNRDEVGLEVVLLLQQLGEEDVAADALIDRVCVQVLGELGGVGEGGVASMPSWR